MNNSNLENSHCEGQTTKKRSLVWKFFEKISSQRVRCRLCKHEQNYQGTTGNILRHLKSRHDLNVTIKGQQDPRNQERIIELMSIASSVSTSLNSDWKPVVIRNSSIASDSSDTVDPYIDNDNKQMIFENADMCYESASELQEYCINNKEKKDQDHKSEKKNKLEEDRILAETEYFREKAAYFRIQKHFTALQAKKIKLEIEEIILKKTK